MTQVEKLLQQYCAWRTQPQIEYRSRPTVEARIAEMQENAGLPGGEGIRWPTYIVDGEAFQARPDGGLGDECERLDGLMRFDRKMRQVAEVVRLLPERHRLVIRACYATADGKPRSSRALAAHLETSRPDADERLAAAHGFAEARLVEQGLLPAN